MKFISKNMEPRTVMEDLCDESGNYVPLDKRGPRKQCYNKKDMLKKAMLKAEQGHSYVEICKYLKVRESFFSNEDKEKLFMAEQAWLLAKARNNFDKKSFNSALWDKYFRIRFASVYAQENAQAAKKSDDKGEGKREEWGGLYETIS